MPRNSKVKVVPKFRQRRSAQDVQDEIFRRMSAAKRIKLASDFSMFLLKQNQESKIKNQ